MIRDIMSRPVSKLIDLDIDEVSVVDRGANQHSLIAFSKSLQPGGAEHPEVSMPPEDVLVFDETGEEVAVDELEHGDTVFDAEGNEYVFVEDELDEDEEIGKAGAPLALTRGSRMQRGAAKVRAFRDRPTSRWSPGGEMSSGSRMGLRAQIAGRDAAGRMGQRYMTSDARKGATVSGYTFGSDGSVTGVEMGRTLNRGLVARDAAIVAGGAAALGGAAYGGKKARDRYAKSLGESVIEELSKAVTDSDRDAIIAKALDEVEIAKAEAAEAMAWAEAEHDARVTEAFISKAAEYNLPVAPAVFGPILKAMAEVLTEEQLDILDDIFTSVGDALYEEIGYVGESSNSSVLDQVNAYADQYVGKSDFSREQMTTAFLEANPAAYDAYLAEMGR